MLITGPESSGKTTLAVALSRELRSNLVPEYARIYLRKLGGKYSKSDLDIILNGQLRAERMAANTESEYLVCDTGPLVMYVWSTEVFNDASSMITASLDHLKTYHNIFLCRPDIPWEADSLRENPEDRHRLFERYVQLLEVLELSYSTISGPKRLEMAIDHLVTD